MLGSPLLQAALVLPRVAVRRASRWSVQVQLQARRNAMVAATVLAQRRAEHLEVEEYLAARFGDATEETSGPSQASTPSADAAHG